MPVINILSPHVADMIAAGGQKVLRLLTKACGFFGKNNV